MAKTPTLAALMHHCKRCKHDWLRRTITEPKMCPKCKTKFWNKERVRKIQKSRKAKIRG